jgi:hypothetical protein
MFGLQVLDIGLGMVFLYLLLSLACTAATELISGAVRLRASTLVQGIKNLIRDDKLQKEFLDHPLIKALHREGKMPSFIPPRTFALTLLHTIPGVDMSKGIESVRDAVAQLPADSDLRKTLIILIDDAGNDLTKLRANVETWFNDTMDRVGGWYKAKAQVITVVVCLLVVGFSNADTIQWVKALSSDSSLREALVAQAEVYAKRDEPAPLITSREPAESKTVAAQPESKKVTSGAIDSLTIAARRIQSNLDEIKKLGIPFGWEKTPEKVNWLLKVVGLLLTVLATSLGAPFWFDMLKKIVNIKTAGASPSDAKDKGEEKEPK